MLEKYIYFHEIITVSILALEIFYEDSEMSFSRNQSDHFFENSEISFWGVVFIRSTKILEISKVLIIS